MQRYVRIVRNMKKKRVTKEPYDGSTLPPSSELGGSFIDFKEAYREAPTKVAVRRVKIVKKRDRKK